MNILNRRMFAIGGQTTLGPYDIRDNETGKVTTLTPGFLDNVMAKSQYAYPLLNGLKVGQLEMGDGVYQELETYRKGDEPFNMSDRNMFGDRVDDVGTAAFDVSRGILSKLEGPIRGVGGFIGEFAGSGPVGTFLKDQSSFDFQKGKRKDYDSFVDTREENRSRILGQLVSKDLGVVPDFAEEITAINNPTIEDQGSVEPSQPLLVEDIPLLEIEPVTRTPVTSGESVGQLYEPGSVGRAEQDARRSAYEASLIGKDEFGNPIERPEPIDNEIANLIQEMTPAELTVNTDLTEEESANNTDLKFDGLSPDELKKEIDKSATPTFDLPAPSMNKVDTTVTESITGSRDNSINRKLQEPGFFGSDRFLDFIRNVGGELVRTGQMGEGLASGAAKAAEERAARDLMAEQENRELKQKMNLIRYEASLKGGETLSGADLTKFIELEDEVSTALKNFDEDQRILSDVNTVINEDLNDPKAFGVGGWIAKISNDLAAAAGMGAEKWGNLSSAKRTEIILEVTAQRSVRNILGESGKTISNLDRDIVAKIFGSVNIFTSKAEIQKKLENSRSNIIEGMRANQNQVISRASGLRKVGYDSDMIRLNASLIDLIMDFNFDDALRYNFKEGTSAGYQEISI